jgi:hypothetical protein
MNDGGENEKVSYLSKMTKLKVTQGDDRIYLPTICQESQKQNMNDITTQISDG